MVGKKQNMAPMWKKLIKKADLDGPTPLLDHENLGCTQRECQSNQIIIKEYTKMFESRISAETIETLLAWSYDMAGHAQKCVERYCGLANKKKTEQLYKVSTFCLNDHDFKKEELETAEELSKVCSQIVLKCLFLARIGRLDILRSVNKFARSVTKWTRACDRRLACLISYITTQMIDYRQYCHVGNTAQHCRLGLFQDSDFAGDKEDPKSTSGGGNLLNFRKSTFRSH